MSDRWKAFLILFSALLAVAATVGGLVWLGSWIDNELPRLAKFLMGTVVAVTGLLVLLAFFVWMLIFYLSILDGIRTRRKRLKEEELSVAG